MGGPASFSTPNRHRPKRRPDGARVAGRHVEAWLASSMAERPGMRTDVRRVQALWVRWCSEHAVDPGPREGVLAELARRGFKIISDEDGSRHVLALVERRLVMDWDASLWPA
jgi:hypothetical protein